MSEPGYRGLCKSQGLRGKEAKKIEGERGGGERGRGGEGWGRWRITAYILCK